MWEEIDRPRRQAARNRPDPGREIAVLERQATNLAAAIAEGGQLTILVEKLRGVEAALEKPAPLRSRNRTISKARRPCPQSGRSSSPWARH